MLRTPWWAIAQLLGDIVEIIYHIANMGVFRSSP